MRKYWKVALPIALGLVVLIGLMVGMAMAAADFTATVNVKVSDCGPPETDFNLADVCVVQKAQCTQTDADGWATLTFDTAYGADYTIAAGGTGYVTQTKQTGAIKSTDFVTVTFSGKNCLTPDEEEFPPKLGCEVQVPEIDKGDVFGTGDWETVIHVFNKGDDDTGVVVFFWGPYSELCPSNAPGPNGHACMKVPKNGVWTLKSQIPEGAQSAIIYTVDADDFQQCCEDAGDAEGSTEDWKDWKLKCKCTGKPIAVVVDRWGPNLYGCDIAAAYEGIAETMEDVGPPFDYFAPYAMRGYHDLTTLLTIQNSGQQCTSIEIFWRRQVGTVCPVEYMTHITHIAPGESIKVIPPTKLGCDWLGSAFVTANQPLGIIVDQVSLPATYTDQLGDSNTCDDTDRCMMRTTRAYPYVDVNVPHSKEVFVDLLFQEFSGWEASIQVLNMTKKSLPTFVTLDVMDQSGDEIEFYADWVCANGGRTFFLPAMVDLGKDLLAGAEIKSHGQVDYPGDEHANGEPIMAVVDLAKVKEFNPATEMWEDLEVGEIQAGAYNAHMKWQKWWKPNCTITMHLPYRQTQITQVVGADIALPKVEKSGQCKWTSMIVLRNNSNCIKIKPKIYFKDETGQVVCYVDSFWLHPKHMKAIDLANIGCLYPGWVGAAEVVVKETKALCDFCPDHCYAGDDEFQCWDCEGDCEGQATGYLATMKGDALLDTGQRCPWTEGDFALLTAEELQECGIMLSVVVVNKGTGTGDMTEVYPGLPRIPAGCLLPDAAWYDP